MRCTSRSRRMTFPAVAASQTGQPASSTVAPLQMARRTAVKSRGYDDGHGEFLLPVLRWRRAANSRLQIARRALPGSFSDVPA